MSDCREIWTIGHSNRAIEPFLDLLTGPRIELIADVRRFPASRKYPHFNGPELTQSLSERGIGYRHFPQLGGRRSKRLPDSPNAAWRVDAFNAYADYMLTSEFAAAIDELAAAATDRRTAILCSEAVPWRCHRRLIADALIIRGWTVWDIINPGLARPHPLTEFARVAEGRITYPAATLFPNE